MSDNSNKIEGGEYQPIYVSTLRGDLKIPFDVFVRVAGKQILYCRRGDSFEGARLERLKSKKLSQMFIRVDDDMAYRQYLESSVDQAYDVKSGKSLEIRAEVIQGFQQAATEQFMDNPSSEIFYDHVRSSSQRFAEFLERETEGLKHLISIKNLDQNIAHHGFNVAALTCTMIKEHSPEDTGHLPLVALGCFLHDIDHFESNFKPPTSLDLLSPTELQSYKQHPARGAEILQGKGFVDPIVYKIISQHEENAQGSGFPRGIGGSQIDELVLYAATANAYDRLLCFEKFEPKEAFKKIQVEKLGLYPLEYLQLLGNILKRSQAL